MNPTAYPFIPAFLLLLLIPLYFLYFKLHKVYFPKVSMFSDSIEVRQNVRASRGIFQRFYSEKILLANITSVTVGVEKGGKLYEIYINHTKGKNYLTESENCHLDEVRTYLQKAKVPIKVVSQS